MYASQVKLLLKYLIYKCNNPKTYFSLSLVNKYCRELTKYYSPMKMRAFCKEINWELTHGSQQTGIAYVLPNGRVLKSVVKDFPLSNCKTTQCFDIKTSTSVYISESNLSFSYCVDIIGTHYEYFYNNKLYSIEKNYFSIKFVTGPKAGKREFSSQRCGHCKQFHDFTVIVDSCNYYNIFRHCGLKSAKYFYYNVKPHLNRRKVIHAVIKYAKNLKSS